ncbi:serine/threonine protein kinase [Lysinibacillus sp. OF-1]|uniref:serine/threonine protein kinase n=1 Tax=Lysinibacillus sp. OF-1 TaxID=2972483 RepID=UPI00232C2B0B|nr:serine/threonine protein kinase [Lysinibacillus sp. OF-1]WCH47028.1 serine/threonine protein kinase [Lysinibacillus sp. OF-1]
MPNNAEVSEQLKLWKETALKLFDNSADSVSITNINQIISTLNTIGTSKASNHMFMPSGGGLDLIGARPSFEKGLVELNLDGTAKIVNPESLTFHPIGDDPQWWYYRLNTTPFPHSGVYEGISFEDDDELKFLGEELLEVEQGNYKERFYWDENHLGHDENGREIPLPDTARIVIRANNGGDYVIFPKFSAYNHNPRTYDARHNKMNGDTFEQYIKNIVQELIMKD